MDKILVTGGSGFVASHIIRSLLMHGYIVKTTVRSETAANDVLQAHSQPKFLSCVIVPDMVVPGAYDEAVKGVDGIIHTASPFSLTPEDNVRDILQPALDGTLGILRSAHEQNPKVKRVVLTSSFAAMFNAAEGYRLDVRYNEEHWNPATWEEAVEGPGLFAYAASKTLAEKAARKFVEDQKPGFDLVTLLPPWVFGPLIMALNDPAKLSGSLQTLHALFSQNMEAPNRADIPVFADVRDVAEAHVRAYEKSAPNQRYIICNGTYGNQEAVDIMRARFPSLNDRLPRGRLEDLPALGIDTSKAVRELGLSFRSFEESVVDTIESILEVEERYYGVKV